MSIDLSVDIRPEQIDEATWIHNHTPQRVESDQVLDLLRTDVPGWAPAALWPKVICLDRFYGTRNHHLPETVRWLSKQLPKVTEEHPGNAVAVVRAIARVPVNGNHIWYWSFASKFAHFFVDPDGAPIYDSWTTRALDHYLGGLRRGTDKRFWYRYHVEQVDRLRAKYNLSCTVRELDRFLFFSGHYWGKAKFWSREEIERDPQRKHLKPMLGLK
jgi:hypothetical protein